MAADRWSELERRGRVLVEEVRCGVAVGTECGVAPGGAGDPREVAWLREATAWLAEAAPAWEDMVGRRPTGRAYRPICSSVGLEAWLITWPAGGRLSLHDHGGAAGAFQVVRGHLMEESALVGPAAGAGRVRTLRTSLVRRVLGEGCGASFAGMAEGGEEYVHDVINPGGPPATSVHLYGPAERPMAFYRIDRGRLRALPSSPNTAAVVDAAVVGATVVDAAAEVVGATATGPDAMAVGASVPVG